MAELCDGDVIFYAPTASLQVIAAHRDDGGRAVFARDGDIVLASGTNETAVLHGALALAGPAVPAESVLAAVASAWALQVPTELDLRRPAHLRVGSVAGGIGTREALSPAPPDRCLTSDRTTIYGSFKRPGPARPQPLEPPHLDRGDRPLHAGGSARSPTCPASKPACARASRAWRRCSPAATDDAGPMAHVLELVDARACRRRPAARSRSAARPPRSKPASTRSWSNIPKKKSAARRSTLAERCAKRPRMRRHAFDIAAALAAAARTRRGRAPGPQHRLHRACRRGAQHPVPPPDRGQPGDVRLGQQAAPHPGRRDRPHRRHRRGHRAGQGTDQEAACTQPACRCRAAASPATRKTPGPLAQRDRPAGRGQAEGRQPGQGRDGQHRPPANSCGRLSRRPRVPRRHHGRALPAGRRFPPAGGRQQAGRRRPPRSAAGGRRRRAHGAPAGRPCQPRPAPRQRPFDFADQDPLRRHRAGAAGAAGLRGRVGAGERPARHPAQQRQPVHRRHRHRRDRRRASGSGGARGRGRAHGRPRHLRRRPGVRQRAQTDRGTGRRHRRSQRRARPAHAPVAVLRQGRAQSAKHHRRHVPGWRRRPHPGHRRHRHQRQDHHRAPDRAPARQGRACASA